MRQENMIWDFEDSATQRFEIKFHFSSSSTILYSEKQSGKDIYVVMLHFFFSLNFLAPRDNVVRRERRRWKDKKKEKRCIHLRMQT